MIGEALALDQDGQEGLGAGVDEAALLKEVRIDVIEEQSGPRGHIHQLATLRREIGLAAESSGQFTFEGQRLASGHRSRSEEHTSELQSQSNLVCRLLLEKKTQMSLLLARLSYRFEYVAASD